MKHYTPSVFCRSHRAIFATLLAYLMLAGQFTPLVLALSASKSSDPSNVAKTARESSVEPARLRAVTAPPTLAAPAPAAFAPIITATKTDAFTDVGGDGKADPGQTISYTVTINNTGPDPATNLTFTDTVDPNTTLQAGTVVASPIAVDETYSVLGNVRIQPNAGGGLLANDNNPNTGNSTGLTASGPTTGPTNGQATVNADGSFSYNPNPGFTGSDSFTYTVTSASGSDTATVTLNVSEMIWFVNSAAGAGGDGRLTSPFNCLVGTGCFDPVAADEAGDNIFLYAGTYADTGALTLLNNQKVIGQGTSAGTTLQAAAGVTLPAHSDALPALNGDQTTVNVSSTASGIVVTTGNSNTLRGFTIGNNGAGAKIFSTAFGTLTVSELILNGNGQALNLDSGVLVATFVSISSNTSGGQGINLDQVTGTLASTNGTTITDPATQCILVTGSTADINFGNTSCTLATDGISLQNNSAGTRTFGTLSVTGGSGVGFLHSVGGGAVNVTGATTITNPTGNGIDIDGSNANLSFAATTVNNNSTSGIGVDLTSNATRTIGFTSLTVTTTNAFALNTNNSGTVNVGGGSLTQSGAGGGAASLTNTALGLTFTSVSSSGGGNGIIISGGSGTFTSGSTNLQNNAGIGLLMSSSAVVANFGNTTVNSSAGDGVDLSGNTGNITFADLDITPDANLRGLDAQNNTGTLTSTSGDIATTGSPALNIAGASAAARTPLSMTLTNVDSTNSTTLGVDLNFVSGNLTVNDPGTATNISNSTGIGIQVRNSGAGTINFGDTNVSGSGGTGVVLGTTSNGNTGAIAFAQLDISPDSGQRPFQATGNTGVITSTSGTIPNSGNVAVEIVGVSAASRTPLNMQLTSVSASGVANGIILQNTTTSGSPGGFVVNGDGANSTVGGNSSGGTISNTSGGDGLVAGNGVYMDTANGITLRRITINGTNQNHGVRGVNSSNFTMEFSTVSGINGTNVALDEGSINFDNLTVAAAITSCLIEGGIEENLNVVNTSGTLNRLTITGSTFGFNNTTNGNNNILLEALNSGTTLNFTLQSSVIKGARADWINASAGASATMDAVIGGSTLALGNTFDNLGANAHAGAAPGGNRVVTGATGTMTIDVRNNTMKGSLGEAIRIRSTGLAGGATGTANARVRDNTIGVQATANSGSAEGSGIFAFGDGGSDMNIAITNNTIHQYNNHGISMTFGDELNNGSVFNATVTGNTVNTPGTINTDFNAIHLNSGTVGATDDFTTCSDIGGAGGLPNSITNGGKGTINPNNTDVRLRQRQNTTVLLPGYGGSNIDVAAVQTYLRGRNSTRPDPDGAAASVQNAVAPSTRGFQNGGAGCTQPTVPVAPDEITDLGTSGAVADLLPNHNPVEGVPSRDNLSSPTASSPPFMTANKSRGGHVLRYSAPGTSAPLAPEPAVQDKSKKGEKTGAPTQPIAPGTKAPKVVNTPTPNPPVIVGDNITWNIGTLPAGGSVTITFDVVVDNPFTGGSLQVSNQGTVTADGGISVLTDDPSVGGAIDPTVTPINSPLDITIRDAKKAEPASGSADMVFTVVLSDPASGTVTVNFTTQDEAPGVGKAVAGSDYTTTTGTVTFMAGDQVKTINVPILSDSDSEPDETFLVTLNTPSGGVIADGTATGTITVNTPGTDLISELRTSGPGGAGDEFIEIYNTRATPVTVAATDASAGWSVVAMNNGCTGNPVIVGVIPNGTVIPARGHYLMVGSAYSLTNYGGTGAAAGNLTFSADIAADANVALFSTSSLINLSSTNVLDAVGFGLNTGGICDLAREATTLGAANGSTSQYSFVRKSAVVADAPVHNDSNDNASDFQVVSTTPNMAVGTNAAPILGAPGPENIAGPNRKTFTQIGAQNIDPAIGSGSAPNRGRDLTPDAPNNSTFGTIAIRRTFTNNTGAPVTRLRFRIFDISTFPVPVGTADLRARTSSNVTVTVTGVGSVTALATTLETPPAQPNGGGLNSSLAAGTITTGTPLANGASINLNFLFGIQQTGSFRVFVIVEALP